MPFIRFDIPGKICNAVGLQALTVVALFQARASIFSSEDIGLSTWEKANCIWLKQFEAICEWASPLSFKQKLECFEVYDFLYLFLIGKTAESSRRATDPCYRTNDYRSYHNQGTHQDGFLETLNISHTNEVDSEEEDDDEEMGLFDVNEEQECLCEQRSPRPTKPWREYVTKRHSIENSANQVATIGGVVWTKLKMCTFHLRRLGHVVGFKKKKNARTCPS